PANPPIPEDAVPEAAGSPAGETAANAPAAVRKAAIASAVARLIDWRGGPVIGATVRCRVWRSGRATRPRTVASAATRLLSGSYGVPSGGQQVALSHTYDQ